MNDDVLANQIIDKLKENIRREGDYVYNNNTGKLHKSTCGRVKLMNNENKVWVDIDSVFEHVLSIMEVDLCSHCFSNTQYNKHIMLKQIYKRRCFF